MESIQHQRETHGLSQRALAKKAQLSFRTVQLLEWGEGDPQISTLEKVASSLGYPAHTFERYLKRFFQSPPDSIIMISERLLENEEAWKGALFNFIDLFRETRNEELIKAAPCLKLSAKMKALLASTVEALCFEADMNAPAWCDSVPFLQEPWFVSGMESLKPSALVESPVFFRKRNVFVLNNFLSRA